MSKLKEIDRKAEEKGSALVTLWQFVKFIVVSLLAMIVQFVLLNTLQLIPAIKELYTQEFNWLFFAYPVAVGGLQWIPSGEVMSIPRPTPVHASIRNILNRCRGSEQP